MAQAALEVGTPVIAVPGRLLVGRRELATAGFSAVPTRSIDEAGVAAAVADPATTLAARAQEWPVPGHRPAPNPAGEVRLDEPRGSGASAWRVR